MTDLTERAMNEALGLPQEPGDFPERSTTPVLLKEYDARWPALFAEERALIAGVLGDLAVAIEHVGSTSVPGLTSKPILDIALAIPSLDVAPDTVEPLATLGYEYVAAFEKELPARRYFRRDARPLHRTHHIHMYAHDHPDFEAFMVFRDRLREDPSLRDEYESLKKTLAATKGRAEYTAGKGPFIVKTLEQARQR